MNYFSARRQKKIVNNLLHVKDNEALANRITVLQNEIDVALDDKVIAVTSINDSVSAAAFGKAMADIYAANGESTLILDANLYEPKLAEITGVSGKKEEGALASKASIDGVDALLMEETVYPGNFYKDGSVHSLIREAMENHEHVIVLVPSLKKHKELVLLGDIVQAIVMTVQKNYTRKESIYYAGYFMAEAKLPLAKAVVLR